MTMRPAAAPRLALLLTLACLATGALPTPARAQAGAAAPAAAPGAGDPARGLYLRAQLAMDEYPGNARGLEQAAQLLDDLRLHHPGSALAHVTAARLALLGGYRGSGHTAAQVADQAHGHITRALQADPRSFEAHVMGAYALRTRGQVRDAVAMARTAEGLRPGTPEVALLRAEMARDAQDFAALEQHVRHVLHNPGDRKALRVRAQELLITVHLHRQRPDLADQAYRVLLALDPNSPWAHGNYSRFLVERRQYEQAIAAGLAALERADFPMARAVLAEAYYHRGAELYADTRQREASVAYFVKSLQHRPTAQTQYALGMAHYHLGHASRQVDRLRQAEDAFLAALQLEPAHTQAQEALAQLHRLFGRLGEPPRS